MIKTIEDYPEESLKKIDEWCACQKHNGPIKKEMKSLDLKLAIDKDAQNKFYEECKKTFMSTQKDM